MSYETTGRVAQIFDTKTVNDYTSRAVLVEVTENNFTSNLYFEFGTKHHHKIDEYNISQGDYVNVCWSPKSNAYHDRNGDPRYSTNLNAFKINKVVAP